ncbi:FAD dependent oxidoreductase family protein [Bordetella holmesii 30539]|uniref:FAD dependent oxidoreductase n=2 Tax=Bordetella holmesii TaxID=35814 RepID=A0A158M4R0_9BORD|nr:FAD-dependent oxidoreductase [Bordetella holmesii]AHV94203.1 FAD dependent oxidoreductase family protein [Bordetella holmesii ATCC 51541]AMD49793.1 nopaline dehydrogenase [Bordetella holmesii F627]EWM42310.1 FAD dependent oxidoreductase family protein [Bordetella holmesii 41130]EXF89201.1 FAD dependent oxidoreductase family protein [Bordetella holmesii 30539]EXX95407.1 FAD dependent oxidoreductase family protein [Bordetella holmesii 1058]KAK83580.1 FAD dependent oxidoreductase [Bordetella 
MNTEGSQKGYRSAADKAREELDVIVAGAGMVGAAIAYGLAGLGQRVLLIDGADTDYRAAKANFGLVWLQGKGLNHPHYQRLSYRSVRQWPAFARELQEESGVDLHYERRGGLHFCLGEAELEARAARMQAWLRQAPEVGECVSILPRDALLRRYPGLALGPEVSGASVGELDGHANPLRLLAALQSGFQRRGGQLWGNSPVHGIRALSGGGFEVEAGTRRARAARLVIAAGLGSIRLGPMVGLDVPLRPQRGQILVTERLAPILPVPANGIRQTGEGTVMVGLTQEEVGFDLSTTTDAAVRMSRNALRVLPALAQARLVRQWSCLRVMTPDGCPVYASSQHFPGAYIALCHSGVTLAAVHAGEYARSLAAGAPPSFLDVFHHERFNVQKVA